MPVSEAMESQAAHRLGLTLEAQGRGALLPLLDEARGSVVAGRFTIDRLLAAGRQSFVFLAHSGAQRDVIKVCAFDYTRPLQLSRSEVASAQRTLEREHEVLSACPAGHLPSPVALVRCTSPVPAASEIAALGGTEVALIEEHIEGARLSELALGPWRRLDPTAREAAARRIAEQFLRFWDGLLAAGWLYGDVSADNLLIDPAGRLRVVDAGSAVPIAPEVVLTGFTPAFTTPHLFDRLSHDQPVPGDASVILPAFAKVLHFALTRREPFNGALPDLADPSFQECSHECKRVLSALLELDARPTTLPDARDLLERWLGG
jgi:hypothetical protein